MGVGHQQALDEVLFLNAGGRLTLTATTLGLVVAQRLILDVALMRQGDHHIFLLDQIFDVDVRRVGGDLGTTRVAELLTDGDQLFADHLHQAFWALQDEDQRGDLLQQQLVLIQQLLVLQAGQLLQTQIQDRLRLLLGQVVVTVADAILWFQPFWTSGIIAGALQHRRHIAQRPGVGDQGRLGFRRRRRMTDHLDDRIDVRQGDGQTFQDMRAFARLAQFENRPARHHFAAVANEGFQTLFQGQQLRLPLMQGDHVDTEGDLHLRLRVEVVQHHLAHRVAFDLDDDTHAVFIGLVAQRADAFDALLFHQLGDFLDQTRLVDLVRDLMHHDGLATILGVGLDLGARAHVDLAAPGTVGLFDTPSAIDDRRRREVRPRDVLHQPLDGDVLIIDIGQATVDHFGQVMGRDIGRHPHGDTGRAVHQQVRYLGRQHVGDLLCAVVVGHIIHRLFL